MSSELGIVLSGSFGRSPLGRWRAVRVNLSCLNGCILLPHGLGLLEKREVLIPQERRCYCTVDLNSFLFSGGKTLVMFPNTWLRKLLSGKQVF